MKTLDLFLTSKNTIDRLTKKSSIELSPLDGRENQLITIYPQVEYQSILGFGGAFTEAGAVTLQKLRPSLQDELLTAYFHPTAGIGYSLCRTHINSCDFSLGNYAYVEKEGDVALESFSLSRDLTALIPFIKKAQNVQGSAFSLFSSPWSPPAWMKDTGKMNLGGKLKEEYHETWARYFARYIKEYEKLGIPIFAVTVQNEPAAVQKWDSCIFDGHEEKDFVKNFLHPTFVKEGLSHTKIIIWDHNKERVLNRAQTAFSDPDAAACIYGIGFHWYSGDHFENLEMVSRLYPDKQLIFTEGCVEGGVKFNAWDSGERYGHDIIGNLTHGTSGWVDWNMLLDETGGPNHVGNFCDAPVIADTKKDRLHYQSSFYYMGHFSKFIRPGAKRIGCSRFTDKLEAVGVKNPDGSIIVVVMNRQNENLTFCLETPDGLAEINSPQHSIMTLIVA